MTHQITFPSRLKSGEKSGLARISHQARNELK
jgi:hypothetical protein